MQNANARPSTTVFQSKKNFTIVLILMILVVTGSGTYYALKAAQAQPHPQAGMILSQQMLSEQYGLGVNLIAVTAAGGMVDLRLRITDAEKAKALLDDQTNFPALRARDGVILQTSEDIASQPIKFEDGANIFVLYMNTQNAVKPGDSVTIVFGDLQVEAIQTK